MGSRDTVSQKPSLWHYNSHQKGSHKDGVSPSGARHWYFTSCTPILGTWTREMSSSKCMALEMNGTQGAVMNWESTHKGLTVRATCPRTQNKSISLTIREGDLFANLKTICQRGKDLLACQGTEALTGAILLSHFTLLSASGCTLGSHTPMALQAGGYDLVPHATVTLLKLVFLGPMGLKQSKRQFLEYYLPQHTSQIADWNTPLVFLWKRPIYLLWSFSLRGRL